ncbi:MAG: hypothetical protein ACJ763_14780 [Bdellovibrionia bacterium]
MNKVSLFGLARRSNQVRLISLLLCAWQGLGAHVALASDTAYRSDASCIVSSFSSILEQYSARLERRRRPTEKGNIVEQPTNDLHELYARARTSKKRFDDSLRRIGKVAGVEAITVSLKQLDRMQSKVDEKLLGDTSALTDILRGTLICDRMSQVQQVKDAIASRFPDVKFFDRFEKPKTNGYRDLQAVVLVPSHKKDEAPIWAEIQVHLRSLYEAKKKTGDSIYRRWRQIEESGARQPLTDEQISEITELKEQERLLYSQAILNAR